MKDLQPLLDIRDKTPGSTLSTDFAKDRIILLSSDGKVLASLDLPHNQAEDLRAGQGNIVPQVTERDSAAVNIAAGCTSFLCASDAFCRGIGCELCSNNPTISIGACLPRY